MLTILSSIGALLVSIFVLLLLAKSDAKRHRKTRSQLLLDSRVRKSLLIMVWLPGLVLIAAGLYSSVLIWLGAITVAGWIVAMVPTKYI